MGYIQLNKKSFFNNLDYLSSICTKDKIAIALKDNAYGHGTYEVAKMCQEYGIKHVFVRDMREANIAQEFGFETILMLYDIPTTKQDNNIITSINSLDDLLKVPQHSKIELKVDTGMNRNGIIFEEIDEAIKTIKDNNLILNGVFTHFCCSDEHNDITLQQEKLFSKFIEEIKTKTNHRFRVHCANSHGVFRVDMSKYDLARIGIAAYGYLDFEQSQYLKPVLSLHAKKISTRYVKIGEHLGYGSKAYITPKNMFVSNYNIGYANGFLRLGETKKAYIADGRPILGRISMDSFTIEGNDDEVCVFDDVQLLAEVHDTIVYEILTTLSLNIARNIID